MLLVYRLLPLILHLRGHLSLLHTLSSYSISALRHLHPGLKYKYLRNNYLFASLSVTDALSIMKYHYRVLSAKVEADFFPRLFNERPLLWEFQKDGYHFGIRVTFPRDLQRPYRMHDHEGDLSLLFEVDGVPIYVLCMTIVPASVAEKNFHLSVAGDVIFIGRVQGVLGEFAKVRIATKALYDITPARLLISATEGIAKIFCAQAIVGVSNDVQLSKRKKSEDLEFFFDYDTFWVDLGARKTDNGLFCILCDAEDKPIEEIQQKHRSRALAKRKFRKIVMDATELGFRQDFF